YLTNHETKLPARIAWLGWSACSQAVGGDSLTLARARDRMLARLLDRGLDAETDLPSFLRFAGRADSERLRQSRTWIDDVRTRMAEWMAADSAGEATGAYTDFFFAFALARLGDPTAARERMRAATAVLTDISDDAQDAHSFLVQAF